MKIVFLQIILASHVHGRVNVWPSGCALPHIIVYIIVACHNVCEIESVNCHIHVIFVHFLMLNSLLFCILLAVIHQMSACRKFSKGCNASSRSNVKGTTCIIYLKQLSRAVVAVVRVGLKRRGNYFPSPVPLFLPLPFLFFPSFPITSPFPSPPPP